jgi:F0F1-type ATP synthase membrane subunit b/b'
VNESNVYVQIAIWSQVASAILFIAVLVYLSKRFLLPMVFVAQEHSNRQIAEAARHRDEAKAALDALIGEIEGAQHDAGLIRERAETLAQHERQATLAEIKESGERLVRNAEGELARARAAARVRLRGELVRKALATARGEAQRKIDDAANARLIESFVGVLERASR